MRIILAPQAAKQLTDLTKPIQKKAHKQFTFLLTNYRYPSLRALSTNSLNVENS